MHHGQLREPRHAGGDPWRCPTLARKHSHTHAPDAQETNRSYQYCQPWFRRLLEEADADPKNLVYFCDETHYLVMTARKRGLLEQVPNLAFDGRSRRARRLSALAARVVRWLALHCLFVVHHNTENPTSLFQGIIKEDGPLATLLRPDNVDHAKLAALAARVARWLGIPAASGHLPREDGGPDVAIFDFTKKAQVPGSVGVLLGCFCWCGVRGFGVSGLCVVLAAQGGGGVYDLR